MTQFSKSPIVSFILGSVITDPILATAAAPNRKLWEPGKVHLPSGMRGLSAPFWAACRAQSMMSPDFSHTETLIRSSWIYFSLITHATRVAPSAVSLSLLKVFNYTITSMKTKMPTQLIVPESDVLLRGEDTIISAYFLGLDSTTILSSGPTQPLPKHFLATSWPLRICDPYEYSDSRIQLQ